MDDYMEIGDSGWIARANGWFYNNQRDQFMDPEGNIVNAEDFDSSNLD